MLSVSDGFREAVVGISRRMMARAIVDIIGPDIVYGLGESSGESAYSRMIQLHDKDFSAPTPYATPEQNRWLLDGSFEVLPDNPADTVGQMGYLGDVLSDSDGAFTVAPWVELQFGNVSVLQACSVYFPGNDFDGVADTFTVEVKQGGTAYFSKTIAGNTDSEVYFDGFTVNNPDAIRVTISKWSLPSRRVRMVEIVPGIYEEWDLSDIVSLDIQMRGNFADLALPYDTAYLRIRNKNRRFEPYTRAGLFRSIEERQQIPISMGPVQADGTVEYAPVGVYFQKSGGWTTGQNDMYIDWELVDIRGLLANRTYQPPAALPTTLGGWFQSFVSQLGDSFQNRWHVDPDYENLPLTVNSAADLEDRTCGALIRYACMATGTWPRADQETGDLTAEPLWSEGSKVTLKQLADFPVKSANDELATLTFHIYDGTEDGSTVTISGNSTSSSQDLTIDNPFLHTADAARTAARQILSQYGGVKLKADGRGDPATEIGDVDTIWISASEAKTGRRMEQQFKITGGVLKNNHATWLQADGSFLFQNRVVLTESGTWTAPAGVTRLRLILVGQGGDGTDGTDGDWDEAGVDGEDGLGALVWSDTIDINDSQVFDVVIGPNASFGGYTSAQGKRYANGYTDIASGDSFARTGVKAPLPGSGDGGAKGVGGVAGNRHEETYRDYTIGGHLPGNTDGVYILATKTVVDNYPTDGTPGVAGATGCVVIYYDKEGEG